MQRQRSGKIGTKGNGLVKVRDIKEQLETQTGFLKWMEAFNAEKQG